MVTLPLTQGQHVLVDDEDVPAVTQHRWCSAQRDTRWYAVSRIDRQLVYLHRFLLAPQRGLVVDHINGDGLDCRRSNMRIVSKRGNSQNSRKRSAILGRPTTSTHKGVIFLGRGHRQWQGQFWVSPQQRFTATFLTEDEAAQWWNSMAREHHREYACLNSI